jgi:Protein of unknown function (DUF3302)
VPPKLDEKAVLERVTLSNRINSTMDDPFLNYASLGILLFVVGVLFFGIIAIHDIPCLIAKSRNHPHHDAIRAAGWVSIYTLHALWPFLWIWAMAYRPDRGWGFSSGSGGGPEAQLAEELAEISQRIAKLEARGEAKSEGRAENPKLADAKLRLVWTSEDGGVSKHRQ